jgi:hypothetical protein
MNNVNTKCTISLNYATHPNIKMNLNREPTATVLMFVNMGRNPRFVFIV